MMPIKIRARFIASTHRDLEEEIEEGHFRSDLFFRLNVVSFRLPPLRQRKEDIPVLVNHFLAKYSQQLVKQILPLSKEVMEAFLEYDYPGNVRELANLVERCVIMAKSQMILPNTLPKELKPNEFSITSGLKPNSLILKEAKQQALNIIEKKVIVENLKHTAGNVTQAAQNAQIARESFQRLMKKYGLSSKDFRKV